MPDRVDPTVQAVEVTTCDAAPDGEPVVSEPPQLRDRHDPVLACGQRGERPTHTRWASFVAPCATWMAHPARVAGKVSRGARGSGSYLTARAA